MMTALSRYRLRVHQEREFTNRMAFHGGVWQIPYNPAIPAFANAEVINPPDPDQLAGFPASSTLVYSENTRERTNAALTMQWAPSDRLSITGDAMFAQNDQESWSVSDLPFFVRQFEFVEFDDDPVVSLPNFAYEPLVAGGGSDVSQAGRELPFRNSVMSIRDELYSIGLNVKYDINDRLTLAVDAAHGEATAGGNNPYGAIWEGVSLGGQAVASQLMDFRSEIPNAIQAIADGSGPTSTVVGGQLVNFAGGNANGIFEASDLGAQYANRSFIDQESTVDQLQINVAWNDGGPVRANFGLGYIENEVSYERVETRDELGGWNTRTIGDIVTLMGEEAVQTVCIACEFDDHDNQILTTDELVADFEAAGGSFAPGSSLRLVGQEAFFVDPYALAAAFDGYTSGTGAVFDNENRRVSSTDDNLITEDTLSVYGEAILDGEVGDMPMQIVFGLRWETTDVESTTLQRVPLFKRWTSDNDLLDVFGADQQEVADVRLRQPPAGLDVSVDVTDNWKRASFSQTIARAPYNNMFLKTTAGNPATATYLGGVAQGSRGNAELEPLESNNLDLSLEYYYGEGSAFTVAYFTKSVSNFIGNEQVTTTLFDLRDVTSGAPGTRSGQAVAELLARGYAATETNLFTMTAILDNPDDFPGGADDFIDPSQPGGAAQASDVANNYDIDPNSADPLMAFIVQQPTNRENAEIDGWELNWVHFFSDALNGFGLQANATLVDGDISYDNSANPNSGDQFALTGLSDSYNLIGFYENDRFSARVLYNWRDEFLVNTNIGNRVPQYADEFTQLDASASFSLTDQLTFTLEGINLLEEPVTFRGRTDHQVQSFTEGDMRLMLGARYVFR
jgi:TonB-dependent receptor